MVRCASSSDDMVFKKWSDYIMTKPTQDEIDTCREVLEYCIAYCTRYEPHAVNTIAEWEATLSTLPNEDELGEVTDG